MTSVPTHRRPLLLAHSYYLGYDEKQTRKMKPYPPLGTLVAAAVLRERGHSVALFDAMLSPGVEAFEAKLDEAGPSIVAIVEDNFNFLTKMCTLRMRRAALEMIAAARGRGCRVVVNGSDATDRPATYLEAGADAVIVGEPELALCDVLDAWCIDEDSELGDIAGLALPAGDGGSGVRRTGVRPGVKDLDALPFPAWDLVDVERYRAAWTNAHGRMSWNMVTSRGCPFGCNWCAKPIFGRGYAQRSPASAAEELRLLRERVRPDHVWFADDIFGLTSAWIEAFAAEVTLRGARTPFAMQSRVNLMKPATVAALGEAGAEEVWMGVESGSQKILDAMDKGSRVEDARTATRALKAQGIRSCWFLQLGYPGEEWDEILLTRDLVREERPDEIGVSVSYPLPGTRFYEMVREQVGRKQNWEDTDDLAMLFHGTYDSEFYRDVRNLLHAETDLPDGSPARRDLDARWAELAAREPAARTEAGVGG
jgi:anaerobic magnesium-protoporphyrin IX monomethyl ester cyclase